MSLLRIEGLNVFEGASKDIAIYGDYYSMEVNVGGNMFILLSFIGMGYGLYILAKKMNIKNVWMSWVPFLQYYMITKVANVSFKKFFLYPILALIIASIIATFTIIGTLMGADILSILSSTIKVTGVISLIFIYILVMYVKTLSAISKRTGRGGWTTLGLFFLPFIMFPVVALKYKKEENKEEEK